MEQPSSVTDKRGSKPAYNSLQDLGHPTDRLTDIALLCKMFTSMVLKVPDEGDYGDYTNRWEYKGIIKYFYLIISFFDSKILIFEILFH